MSLTIDSSSWENRSRRKATVSVAIKEKKISPYFLPVFQTFFMQKLAFTNHFFRFYFLHVIFFDEFEKLVFALKMQN